MDKPYDDSNWRNEYIDIKSTQLTKRQVELLEKGPHSLSQAWLIGAMHNDWKKIKGYKDNDCLLYTSPSPRDRTRSRMPSSA